MGLLSLTLPTIGQPNATEDSKVRDALASIQTEFNGNIELTNIASGLQELLIPTATVLSYASSTAPSGFLICDGAAISRGTYSALFTKIGESYGVGDGSTTFNLPDLQGRVPVGKGTHTSVDALGDNDGTALASRTPKHWHDADALTANVYLSAATPTGGGIVSVGRATSGNPAFTGGGLIDILGDVGVTTGPQDTPAYLVLNYIIKT